MASVDAGPLIIALLGGPVCKFTGVDVEILYVDKDKRGSWEDEKRNKCFKMEI